MNKKRVVRAAPAASREAEALARAVNIQPWEPPPGMEKRQCPRCRYLFAAPQDAAERRCPDCGSLGSRPTAEP